MSAVDCPTLILYYETEIRSNEQPITQQITPAILHWP